MTHIPSNNNLYFFRFLLFLLGTAILLKAQKLQSVMKVSYLLCVALFFTLAGKILKDITLWECKNGRQEGFLQKFQRIDQKLLQPYRCWQLGAHPPNRKFLTLNMFFLGFTHVRGQTCLEPECRRMGCFKDEIVMGRCHIDPTMVLCCYW